MVPYRDEEPPVSEFETGVAIAFKQQEDQEGGRLDSLVKQLPMPFGLDRRVRRNAVFSFCLR
jgi:hypothetical protein